MADKVLDLFMQDDTILDIADMLNFLPSRRHHIQYPIMITLVGYSGIQSLLNKRQLQI